MNILRASAFVLLLIVAVPALAGSDSAVSISLADAVRDRSIIIALWASAISVTLILIAMFAKNASNELKKLLFALIAMSIVGPTGYFIWSTVSLNVQSAANGPVHWHTDFQIYACGEKLPPPNPKGTLSNRTGTPVLHQHADDRLHVEGVVIEPAEIELDRFFEVQGGTLTESAFRVPTGDTITTYLNGDYCPGGTQGIWNVFLYRVDENTMTATQTKLTDYAHYVPAPHELPPLIDCLIFEFGPETTYTDRLCNFHQIAVNNGELKVEIPAKDGAGVPPAGGEQGVIDTSGWQTYRNETHGITFQYPAAFPKPQTTDIFKKVYWENLSLNGATVSEVWLYVFDNVQTDNFESWVVRNIYDHAADTFKEFDIYSAKKYAETDSGGVHDVQAITLSGFTGLHVFREGLGWSDQYFLLDTINQRVMMIGFSDWGSEKTSSREDFIKLYFPTLLEIVKSFHTS
ncbi:MAG: hypothetical protein AAB343_01470 [Patescibacteria group bacterium]